MNSELPNVVYEDKILSLKRNNDMIIKASSDLRNDYASVSKLAKESGEPIYITLNGEGDGVFMDIKSFERMKDLLALKEHLLQSESEIGGKDSCTLEEIAARYGVKFQ